VKRVRSQVTGGAQGEREDEEDVLSHHQHYHHYHHQQQHCLIMIITMDVGRTMHAKFIK